MAGRWPLVVRSRERNPAWARLPAWRFAAEEFSQAEVQHSRRASVRRRWKPWQSEPARHWQVAKAQRIEPPRSRTEPDWSFVCPSPFLTGGRVRSPGEGAWCHTYVLTSGGFGAAAATPDGRFGGSYRRRCDGLNPLSDQAIARPAVPRIWRYPARVALDWIIATARAGRALPQGYYLGLLCPLRHPLQGQACRRPFR